MAIVATIRGSKSIMGNIFEEKQTVKSICNFFYIQLLGVPQINTFSSSQNYRLPVEVYLMHTKTKS